MRANQNCQNQNNQNFWNSQNKNEMFTFRKLFKFWPILIMAIALLTACDSGGGGGGLGGGGNIGGGGSFVHEGQTYKTVVIGTQTWMAENLNYNASGSICYNNLESNCNTYGRLYDWATAKTVCPNGWHLPTQLDLYNLDMAGPTVAAQIVFVRIFGGYSSNGKFYGIGNCGVWWGASDEGIHYLSAKGCEDDIHDENPLFSVVCVQD